MQLLLQADLARAHETTILDHDVSAAESPFRTKLVVFVFYPWQHYPTKPSAVEVVTVISRVQTRYKHLPVAIDHDSQTNL